MRPQGNCTGCGARIQFPGWFAQKEEFAAIYTRDDMQIRFPAESSAGGLTRQELLTRLSRDCPFCDPVEFGKHKESGNIFYLDVTPTETTEI